MCACGLLNGWTALMWAAQNVGYQPEWLLGGLQAEEEEGHWQVNKQPEDLSRIFGISSRNKYRSYVDEPWLWAVKESDPAAQVGDGALRARDYEQLLLLASGIQSAGPDLTPQNFERGLRSSQFPNPGAGQAPYWQASVGFGPNRHSMISDLALWWWDSASRREGYATSRGQFCYVNRGERWSSGGWPEGQSFFDRTQPCR
jgi:hypothetical protein